MPARLHSIGIPQIFWFRFHSLAMSFCNPFYLWLGSNIKAKKNNSDFISWELTGLKSLHASKLIWYWWIININVTKYNTVTQNTQLILNGCQWKKAFFNKCLKNKCIWEKMIVKSGNGFCFILYIFNKKGMDFTPTVKKIIFYISPFNIWSTLVLYK